MFTLKSFTLKTLTLQIYPDITLHHWS